MKVRTFHAATMKQGLAQVRKEMGASAVILHTRTVRSGGVWGIGSRPMVELTAADAAEVARQRRKAAQAARPAASLPLRRSTLPGTGEDSATLGSAGDLIRRTYAAARAELTPGTQTTAVSPTFAPAPAPQATHLADEMASVKRMVARMMRQQREAATEPTGGKSGKAQPRARSTPDLPDKLFNQYLALLEQEVTEELAEEIIQGVHDKLGPPQLADESAVREAVCAAVAKLMPADEACIRCEKPSDGRPRTIALIGPTGVGKTTTVAKLAATFKLKQHKQVGLVTLDTYRIAAVDQLRTYANIIGLPLSVAANAAELSQALKDFRERGCDVVLMDTAGRSQRDDPKLDQLQSLIRAADPHEVHLVLSSTCAQAVLLEAAERFGRTRVDRIIFTKLDEAVSFGVLLNVARRVNKQLSFVTTGQEVPHQIEPGDPRKLAELVTGGRELKG